MAKYLTEILTELNDNPKLSETTYKDNSYLKIIFSYAYLKANKFNLPKGKPPFTENPKPLGMSETNILYELRKFPIFTRTDLTPLKIESLFISLLEAIHPDEAAVMLAIKDQRLNKLYPKLTKKFAINAGYIEEEVPDASSEVQANDEE